MGRPRLAEGVAKNRPTSMTDETSAQLDELVYMERALGKGIVTRASWLRRIIDREWKKMKRAHPDA